MNDNPSVTTSHLKQDLIIQLPDELADVSQIMTCIQCGSCTASCVAAEGMSLSPRRIWRAVQDGAAEKLLTSDSPWHCTTCSLCEERCPRGISLGQIILSLRAWMADRQGLPGQMDQAVTTLQSSRNITGDTQDNRWLWLDNMDLTARERTDLFKAQADCVYFTGCVASLFPQVYKIPQSLTRLLLDCQVDFSLLEDEWCCSYPLLGSGQGLEAMRPYARHNIEAIHRKGAHTILFSCPTCLYLFKKVYPQLVDGMDDFTLVHYSEYLSMQVLPHTQTLNWTDQDITVTYHDPCDLGRKLHITAAPRQLLAGLPGVKLVEMRFSGSDGKCCGGGGNLEMANPDLAAKIAAQRISDAMETGAAALVTSCQQCKRTLMNAARKSRARIKVFDLLEFMAGRMVQSNGGAAR